MNLLETGISLLNTAAYIYAAACICYFVYIWSVDKKRENFLREASKWLVFTAFAVHTAGLAVRWYDGGFSRPPWTNLYESLVAFAWGASLIQVIVIRKWKVTIVGAFSVPLITTLMTMALMTPTKEVEPLIPALQSGWLKVHVSFAILAYSSFTASACIAVLYLLRRGISFSKIAALICWISVFNLGIAGGRDAFRFDYIVPIPKFATGGFFMARQISRTMADGKVVTGKDSYQQYEGGPMITRMERVPTATIPYWLSLFGFLISGIVLWRTRRKVSGVDPKYDNDELSEEVAFQRGNDLSRAGRTVFQSTLVVFLGFLGTTLYGISHSEAITLRSNPYLLFLMVMTCFFVGTFAMIHFRYKSFLGKLPSAARLNELSYVCVLMGFPLQTLLLITGAIWAYFAWGRSWGWDPKETWALITWLLFLIYLHGKLLMRWKGPTLAVVAIIGFVILCFAFLGVNLVLSGLHSYGAA